VSCIVKKVTGHDEGFTSHGSNGSICEQK
jgi:hypothetical protein